MAILTGQYYTHPQETWDEAKCRKMARTTQKDGMGTPYPFKGYIPQSGSALVIQGGYGKQRLNGGCVHGDNWYEGEERLLPIVAKGFKLVRVPTWGWRIVEDK
jgi:hypothetical protein